MNFFKAVLISSILLIAGCQSSTVLEGGGYKFIHFNNPECMGQSGAGGLLTRSNEDEVITANMSFKTGYCEAITGQAIAIGGEVGKAKIIANGLEDSGTSVKGVSGSEVTATGGTVSGSQSPSQIPQ